MGKADCLREKVYQKPRRCKAKIKEFKTRVQIFEELWRANERGRGTNSTKRGKPGRVGTHGGQAKQE